MKRPLAQLARLNRMAKESRKNSTRLAEIQIEMLIRRVPCRAARLRALWLSLVPVDLSFIEAHNKKQ